MSVRPAGTSPAALLVTGSLAAAAIAVAQPPPVFPTRSEVVYVDAYVTRGGRPVRDLRAGDFEVRDRGRLQRVELVSSEAAHLHVVMALDRSQSMVGAPLEHAREAARAFLAGLRDDDRVTLLAFDYRIDLLDGPAGPPAAAARALDGLKAQGQTALRDALYVALELAAPEAGRPVVVAFSDGLDASSVVDEDDLLRAARAADASVYAVSGTPAGAAALGPLCAETGGRVLEARPGPRLQAAFADVLKEIKDRYVLGFSPTDPGAGWHALEVRLRAGRRGAEVRARRGYERR